MTDIVHRLNIRASIRRQIATRKSVQEGKPDRIADLLEEAAQEIEKLRKEISCTTTPTFALRSLLKKMFW